MTLQMDLMGDHRMDWSLTNTFTGPRLPVNQLQFPRSTRMPSGDVVFVSSGRNSGVDDQIPHAGPIYRQEWPTAASPTWGVANVVGKIPRGAKVTLKGMKNPPKRALVNYKDDVLGFELEAGLGFVSSAGLYPLHASTGSRGYFGIRGM